MKYAKLIAVSYADMAPELLMLSDATLGALSKAAVRGIAGYENAGYIPDNLKPLMHDIEERWVRMPLGKSGTYPPLWIVLAEHCETIFPVQMALDDEDAGMLLRQALVSMAPDLESDAPEAVTSQTPALRSGSQRMKEWLDSDIPAEIIESAITAEDAAAAIGEHQHLSEDQIYTLAKQIAALTILDEMTADNEDDADMVRIGRHLAEGGEDAKKALPALLADADRKRRERERQAASRPRGEDAAGEESADEDQDVYDDGPENLYEEDEIVGWR